MFWTTTFFPYFFTIIIIPLFFVMIPQTLKIVLPVPSMKILREMTTITILLRYRSTAYLSTTSGMACLGRRRCLGRCRCLRRCLSHRHETGTICTRYVQTSFLFTRMERSISLRTKYFRCCCRPSLCC